MNNVMELKYQFPELYKEIRFKLVNDPELLDYINSVKWEEISYLIVTAGLSPDVFFDMLEVKHQVRKRVEQLRNHIKRETKDGVFRANWRMKP